MADGSWLAGGQGWGQRGTVGRWARAALALVVAAGVMLGGGGGAPERASADAYRVMLGRIDSSKFPAVTFSVTVLDHRYVPVTDLNASKWELLEDNNPVPVGEVKRVIDAENPIAVVLGLDANANTDGRPLRDLKEAANDFIFNLQPNDAVAAVTFGDAVKLVNRFTTDKPAVAARVRDVRPTGLSVLYDGISEALDLAAREPMARKVLLFLSDGQDVTSRTKLNDLLKKATDTRVPIFTIGLGEGVNMDALRKISDASGGVALHAPTSTDLLGAYQTVANHLRSEFQVSFRSNLKALGQRHTLTVRPILPEGPASAQIPFVSTKIAPTIEVPSPAGGAELPDLQPIEVKVSGAAEIARVELSSGGKVLASLSAPPWRYEWDTTELKTGQHTLNVTAYDAADNRATKFVPLVVNNRTTVIKTMQQPQAPVVANSGDSGPPIWLILLGLLALAPAWFVLKRAGGMAQRKIMPLRCSTHNVSYQPGTVCPRCAAESSSSIGGRLRRFSVEQPAPEPGAGASAERERRAS